MLLVLRCWRLVLLWLLAVELSLLVIYRQIRCAWRCLPHLTKLTYVVGGSSRWCCHHWCNCSILLLDRCFSVVVHLGHFRQRFLIGYVSIIEGLYFGYLCILVGNWAWASIWFCRWHGLILIVTVDYIRRSLGCLVLATIYQISITITWSWCAHLMNDGFSRWLTQLVGLIVTLLSNLHLCVGWLGSLCNRLVVWLTETYSWTTSIMFTAWRNHHLCARLHLRLRNIRGRRIVRYCLSNSLALIKLLFALFIYSLERHHRELLVAIGSSWSTSKVEPLTVHRLRVIVRMWRDERDLPRNTIDQIVRVVIIELDLAHSNCRPHISVSVDILKNVPALWVLIGSIYDIYGLWGGPFAANLIFLASLFFHFLLGLILLLHELPSLHVSIEILKSASLIISIFIFFLFGSDFFVIRCEVLLKTIIRPHIVRTDLGWLKKLESTASLRITANSSLHSLVRNSVFVSICELYSKSSRLGSRLAPGGGRLLTRS